jgi:phosphate transport system substrate-binding protein
VLLAAVMQWGCGGSPQKTQDDETLSSGLIHISVDESFRPVIDSQIRVFEASYPNGRIVAHYKPEAECLKDLMYDSIRMVIVTRGLTEGEVELFRDTLGYAPRFGKLASDAIAVVVNQKAKDSMFDVRDIKGMLAGMVPSDKKLVMDGLQATSTVRFMLDSVLRGDKMAGKVQAATTSEGVIEYVSNNTGAIGFVGVSWIGNKEDSTQLSFLTKVRIASLNCRNCPDDVYVKPYQANIVMRRYPMVRGLHYILKENYAGLGSGFVNFLTMERGQLIFKRAYLAPSKMLLQVRRMDMEESSF